PRAVGAAAHRSDDRPDPRVFHRPTGKLHNPHHRFDFLPHVVILVPDADLNAAFTVPGPKFVRDGGKRRLARLESAAVEVADDEAEFGLVHAAFQGYGMIEALVSFGLFRRLALRQLRQESGGHAQRVDHFSFRRAGMDVRAKERDPGFGGVERLELQLAEGPAVHRVGERGAEGGRVEAVRAPADFLVGREGDAHLAAFDFRMAQQIVHGGHDFGDAGFVVGAEQGGAVRGDQRVAGVAGQLRDLAGGQDDAFRFVPYDVAALVPVDDPRLDPRAG